MKRRILVNTFGVGTLALLFGTSSPGADRGAATAHRPIESRKPVQGVIDVLNLFRRSACFWLLASRTTSGFRLGSWRSAAALSSTNGPF